MATDLKQLLERKPVKLVTIDPQNPETAVDEEIAKQAAEMLGYKRELQRRIGEENAERLAQALRDENIQPFTEASVKQYQRAIVRRAFWGMAEKILCLLFVVSVALGILLSPYFFFASLALLYFYASAGGQGTALFNGGQWVTTPIAEYQNHIPTSVLHTAIRLKRRLSEATLHVSSHRRILTNPDPFLIVRLGKDDTLVEKYVEVWDEPSFTGERS